MLATFDAPNGDASCVRRLRSNTPLQALTTLNETVFVECARALARKVLEDGGRTDAERLTDAFRRVLGRTPTDDERTVLLDLLESQMKRIAEGRVNPRELATGTDRGPDLRPSVSPAQLAAYTVVLPGAAEPRRDDHQGVSNATPEPLGTHPERAPHRADAPLVLPGMRRGPGRHRARAIAGRDRRRRNDPSARPAGPQVAALSPPGPSGSSTCSWPAGRASSSCSTTSPNWRSGAASSRRPSCCKGYRAAFISPSATLLGPRFAFGKHGASGAEISELLPHLAGVADDITIVKSMQTDAFNHAPGQIFMNTGSQQFGRPSMGAWATYGLGSESQDLPGLRRLQHRHEGHQRRRIELGLRLPPLGLPGRPVPEHRRPGPLSLQPARVRRCRPSATRSTPSAA